MTPDHIVERNRINSLKSTWPNTELGKYNSSQNAITHGLRARKFKVFKSEQRNYDKIYNQLISELSPQSAIETMLLSQIAEMFIKLQRIWVFEELIFNDENNLSRDKPLNFTEMLFDKPWEQVIKKPKIQFDYDRLKALDILWQYEQRLVKSFHKAIERLQDILKSRDWGDFMVNSMITNIVGKA